MSDLNPIHRITGWRELLDLLHGTAPSHCRAELHALGVACSVLERERDEARARVSALAKENERLRNALGLIAQEDAGHENTEHAARCARAMQACARAALGEKEETRT